MKTIKNLTADELKKSILQLAIQGKLVKQNPDDEPASELVKRIYEEKNKLIAEGKIKKDKNQSYIYKGDDNCYYEKIGNNEPVKLEDLPFDIPDNWMWIKVKEIFDIRNGFTPLRTESKYWENGDINWFTIEDIRNQGRLISNTVQKINHIACTKDRIVPANSLLLCCTASIGEYALTKVNLTTNQQFNALTHKNDITKLYNMNFIFSIASTFKERLTELAGKTTFAFVSTKKLGELMLPLPPLEEQQRIVDKINSFELLLEKYDKVEKELSKLEKEFPEKLKKSILQYAIEGKLVKQNPNDEPASVLLERIKQEKERLIKEGKIKRDKNESYIYQGDDKIYYEQFPNTWEVVRLKNICEIKGGKRIPSGAKFSLEQTSHKYLRITDMKYHSIIGCAYISNEIYNTIRNYTINYNDIYITCAGTIGYIGIIPKEYDGANLTENANKLLLNSLVYKNWFIQCLCSEICQKQIRDCTTKVGQPKLAIKRIEQLLIPLPPYEEQQRIYHKTMNLIKHVEY